ncbi:Gfo/Idh/MocA family protein [Paenibacillus ginsengarvi]|uniref:Gfo/Idh/MocA family oxidoreductase n=1 Tax=Paenibacillus ginsengarvi TaxID=400777 RepID=A0A3B0BLR8_9BACL|nr:Gfo/Idh/MocA family oxidoreductase [Paenibacillus ginsengarvi]RKN74132.1 gfo/Idh/MocA family oxidoreductase [Paenibacillus ginsengarvi]
MTLRIGIIGTGRFAAKHGRLAAQMEDTAVVAICGRTMENAERLAQNWPGAKAYDNVEHMLDDGKLDAVYICVTPAAHGDIEMSVARRGIPFFTEKPIGIDPATIAPVRELVAEKKLVTCVGYNWRYSEAVNKARVLLQPTTIGMANGYWMGGLPSAPWWRSQSGSGGQFVEQSTHAVDLVRYLCGEIREVYAAFGYRHIREIDKGADVADVGSVILKLDNGIVATISNTCLLPAGHRSGLDLYTSGGVMEIRSNSLKAIGKARTTEYRSSDADPYTLENEAFLHAVRTGDTSRIRSDYADAFRTFEATAAAVVSAEQGTPVKLGGVLQDER